MRGFLVSLLTILYTSLAVIAQDVAPLVCPDGFNQSKLPVNPLADAQPDTLLYDNNVPAILSTMSNAWHRVRFTPPADFTIRSVYGFVIDGVASPAACSLFVFTAPPAPGTERTFAYEPAPLPNLGWFDANFNTPVDIPGGTDFWIIIGPIPGGPQGDANWNLIADNGTTTSRSTVSTSKFGSQTAFNYDLMLRVGGTLGDFHQCAEGEQLCMLSPNGDETYSVSDAVTIEWLADIPDSYVRLQINRNAPAGEWETISDSVPNTGSYSWGVTDPLSDNCRMRVCTSLDQVCDESDNSFSVYSELPYIALVRPAAQNVPVLGWDLGQLECPAFEQEIFHWKNFGRSPGSVFDFDFDTAEPPFDFAWDCGAVIDLDPNEMSTCPVTLSFNPSVNGAYADDYDILAAAVNGWNTDGYIFPLRAEQVATPTTPELVVSSRLEDIRLDWAVVDSSIGGCAVSVNRYLVFYSEYTEGPFFFHGWTPDTTYLHTGVVTYAEAQFYRVVGVDLSPTLLADLEPGTEMTELLAGLRNRHSE